MASDIDNLIKGAESSEPLTLDRMKEVAMDNERRFAEKKTLSKLLKDKLSVAKEETRKAKQELKPAVEVGEKALSRISESQVAQRIARERTTKSPGKSVYVQRLNPQYMRPKADLVNFDAKPQGVGVMNVGGAGFYLERDGGFGLDAQQPFGVRTEKGFDLERQSSFGVGDGSVNREPALSMGSGGSRGFGFGIGNGSANREPALSMGSGNPKKKNVFSLR